MANGFDTWHADAAAVRLHLHPAMIWPGWVEAGLTVLDELHLAGGNRQIWCWNEEQATA
jgi:hypothetical protein